MKTLKRTWADISLDNLEYNYRSIRAHLPSGTRFLGVMKADAYGHGAVPVSRALADLGAEYLAVSNLEEAVQIRRGEVRLPILILGYTPAIKRKRISAVCGEARGLGCYSYYPSFSSSFYTRSFRF